MQKLSDKKNPIISEKGRGLSAPVTSLKKSTFPSPSRANLAGMRNWVGLEERIVHDYKEQKTAQLKTSVLLPKAPVKQSLSTPSNLTRQGRKVALPPSAKRKFSFFDFFIFPKKESQRKTDAVSPKVSVLGSVRSVTPRADLSAVKNWVGLEEKIVHDYQDRKIVPPQTVVSRPKMPAKQSRPAFETFSTQTTVSLSAGIPKLKDPLRRHSQPFLRSGWVLGVLVVGAVAFLYMQVTSPDRAVFQKFTQLQNEKTQLEQAYAELKSVSESQRVEMGRLNQQFREMASELKIARDRNRADRQSSEKAYREELMRITLQYELQMKVLRETLLNKESAVIALKAQIGVLEKILDQARMSAVSGIASKLFQGPVPRPGVDAFQARITSINERQGFVVIDRGADRGARSGRRVAILRGGIGLAVGHIDRVYPTMSCVVVHNTSMLPVIQEGDTVSFF